MRITLFFLACFFAVSCMASNNEDLRDKALALYESGDQSGAFDVLSSTPLAEAADIQFQISLMYQHGDGVEQDDTQALAWLIKSIAQGHCQAIAYMGNVYRFGLLGFEKDTALADYWDQFGRKLVDSNRCTHH